MSMCEGKCPPNWFGIFEAIGNALPNRERHHAWKRSNGQPLSDLCKYYIRSRDQQYSTNMDFIIFINWFEFAQLLMWWMGEYHKELQWHQFYILIAWYNIIYASYFNASCIQTRQHTSGHCWTMIHDMLSKRTDCISFLSTAYLHQGPPHI